CSSDLPNSIKNNLMPDVRGMTLRDAVFLLENKGLEVTIQGKGRVTDQSIWPGSNIEQQNKIVLTLGS
ncbi:MAG: PASTA domain-containing protein, partial [Cyclobacteriaceae bacterium]